MTQEADIVIAVESALKSMGVEYELFEIDAEFADTAAFCERYDFPLDSCGNTIVVASKRGAKKYSACIVKGTDRLDVNKRVKGLMEVSRVSFASADETAAVTGMMIGGVTPFALPGHIPVYVDAKVMELDYVILGSGSRSSKIETSPAVLNHLPKVEVVEGLSLG